MDILEARPDASQHEVDASAYDSSVLVHRSTDIVLVDLPPIHDCTPYQMQAMAARLNTGHRDPHMPNDARQTTGKPT